jgi:flagellar motor switch protein FliM
MKDDAAISTLRRKAGAGRTPPEPAAMSPAAFLRKAVAQAGEDLHGLVATVAGFGESRATLSELVDGLPDPALLMSLIAHDGRRGLAIVDVQVVAALVEHLTTGRIVPGEAASRMPTRTDAVMVSDFLDRFLAEFDQGLEVLADAPPVSGFRYGARLAEPRMVQMALADVGFRLYRLRLDLGRGARGGELVLALPFDKVKAPGAGAGDSAGWKRNLAANVMAAEAPLRAVLHRVLTPLSEVAGWIPGALLEIPAGSVFEVEVEGLDGRVVATGSLGHVAGDRAVRLQTAGTSSIPSAKLRPAPLPGVAAPVSSQDRQVGADQMFEGQSTTEK